MLLQHNINFTISLSYNLCKLLFMILTSLTFYFFYKQKKKIQRHRLNWATVSYMKRNLAIALLLMLYISKF